MGRSVTGTSLLVELDHLAEWVDAVFALGWRAAGRPHRDAGERIARRLEDAGLHLIARTLEQTLASSDDEITQSLGQLCVVLEMTREAIEIERLKDGTVVVEDAVGDL